MNMRGSSKSSKPMYYEKKKTSCFSKWFVTKIYSFATNFIKYCSQSVLKQNGIHYCIFLFLIFSVPTTMPDQQRSAYRHGSETEVGKNRTVLFEWTREDVTLFHLCIVTVTLNLSYQKRQIHKSS